MEKIGIYLPPFPKVSPMRSGVRTCIKGPIKKGSLKSLHKGSIRQKKICCNSLLKTSVEEKLQQILAGDTFAGIKYTNNISCYHEYQGISDQCPQCMGETKFF